MRFHDVDMIITMLPVCVCRKRKEQHNSFSASQVLILLFLCLQTWHPLKRYYVSPQMRLPSLSFASQLHTVTRDDESVKGDHAAHVASDVVPKMPSAMVALPARRASQNALAQQRAMATAAHADDHHHGPYWVAHPFHVLPPSPWPFYGGLGAGLSCLGA